MEYASRIQHARRVVLQLLIDEPLELGELEDLVEPARVELSAGQA